MLLNCQIKLIIKTFNKKNKFKIKEKINFNLFFLLNFCENFLFI
jgi:hypothetical protein